MASAICAVCGKKYNPGRAVSHSNVKTHRKWRANLQNVKIKVDGTVMTAKVCTRCIKGNRVAKA